MNGTTVPSSRNTRRTFLGTIILLPLFERLTMLTKAKKNKTNEKGRLGSIAREEIPEKRPTVQISPPNMEVAEFLIQGTSPYVQHKMSAKVKAELKAKHEAGSKSQSKKDREAKDFKALYKAAMHISKEGWNGIPAPAFRSAMIRACSLVNFVMTRAKLSIKIIADSYDQDGATPLVKITKGKPHMHVADVRNETGVVDLRSRPMWDPGWQAKLRVEYDADQFSLEDVTNLLMRVGIQVGIGEGRNSSKKSDGCGWGFFVLVNA